MLLCCADLDILQIEVFYVYLKLSFCDSADSFLSRIEQVFIIGVMGFDSVFDKNLGVIYILFFTHVLGMWCVKRIYL